MPNYTDNLGLIQPLGSEKIRIAQINQNMDTLDEAVGAVGDKSLQQQILDIGGGIAIMANGNTHPAITAGQFVFVRNHGTLADGAYTANSNIAENATLSSSNLTAVPGGGFNALKAGITSLSDHITPSTELLATGIRIYRCWKMRKLLIDATVSSDVFYTLGSGDKPSYEVDTVIRYKASDNKFYPAVMWVASSGQIKATYYTPGGASVTSINSGAIVGNITWFVG
jgi:hypothetical protein